MLPVLISLIPGCAVDPRLVGWRYAKGDYVHADGTEATLGAESAYSDND